MKRSVRARGPRAEWWAVFALAALFVAWTALPWGAFAQEPTVTTAVAARVGEQFTFTVEVEVPAGTEVEVDPANPSWNGVEVIRIRAEQPLSTPNGLLYRFRVTAAPFVPGVTQFAPAVTLIASGVGEGRVLDPIRLDVRESLADDAPLELSPLAGPVAIGGAESPWLRPAIGAGIVAGAGLLVIGGWLVARRVATRPRGADAPPPAPAEPDDLRGLEELLQQDPALGYRRMASSVRHVIARRYGLPAGALTTGELQRRMEQAGLDRWQARLVGGLLQECDAVVYAGYRPAPERREADLNMAREIVEGGAA